MIGNHVGLNGSRGFESLLLRHKLRMNFIRSFLYLIYEKTR